jgi:hypothetical protein
MYLPAPRQSCFNGLPGNSAALPEGIKTAFSIHHPIYRLKQAIGRF